MGPIFNKKVAKKYNLWDREQYTYALFTVDKVNNCGLKKKDKKKKKRKTWRRNIDVGFIANQTVTIRLPGHNSLLNTQAGFYSIFHN